MTREVPQQYTLYNALLFDKSDYQENRILKFGTYSLYMLQLDLYSLPETIPIKVLQQSQYIHN